jgi:prepilin-type N-terminal cleavage/methylation domain-containing protein
VYPETSRRDHGATLIELVIAMAVASIAAVIVTSTLGLVQRATNQIEATSVAIDSARLVSAGLDRELRSADCISTPGENLTGNTLTFRTTINTGGPVMLTYQVDYGTATQSGTVTRTEGLGDPRVVIDVVGLLPSGSTGSFNQVNTPLRTLVIKIPIRSDNGGSFLLETTVAGRNSWRPCA